MHTILADSLQNVRLQSIEGAVAHEPDDVRGCVQDLYGAARSPMMGKDRLLRHILYFLETPKMRLETAKFECGHKALSSQTRNAPEEAQGEAHS